ncbi:MAG: hypothetical protein CSA49_04450, partial [Gammaproteobacteria bacterium]
MMVDPSVANEAVLFFEGDSISKEMTYSEFEAVLDGVVGLNDLAGDQVSAAYVHVNGHLKVSACVLFKINFDRLGFADKSWNIPLRHLADTAARGPDMGAGPIRLACKSQCSVSWHQPQLWDPVMTAHNNTFAKIHDAVANNRLCLPTTGEPEFLDSAFATENQWTMAEVPLSAASESAQPLKEPPVLSVDESFDGTYVDDQELGLTESLLEALESAHRKKMASLIRQQHLHVKTMQNEHQQELAKLKLNYEQSLQQLEIDVARLANLHESLHSQNIALREQNEAQRRQLETFKKTRNIELQKAEAYEKQQVDALRSQYEELMAQRVAEETAKLKEQIELRNMELMHRHEVAKKLREELCDLRRDKLRLVNDGGDKFLDRLEALGISFIAFHPGAGRISILLKDMGAYMENPIGFAADRCLVSEEHYRVWLEHYHNPVCQ